MMTIRSDLDVSDLALDPAAYPAHVLQLYEEDDHLVEEVARFLGGGLRDGEAAIAVATGPHRDEVEARLTAAGIDLVEARAEGRWVALDAADTLARIMAGDRPDPVRFSGLVRSLLTEASGGGRRVRVFGEMVALLCAAGNPDAAVALEEMWSGLARELPFALLCGYRLDALRGATEPFARICGAHSTVVPSETYTRLPAAGRSRAVANLQLQAQAMETAVAHGKHAEESLRERAETLRRLIETSPLPTAVIDLDATVRLWNPAAEALFGWKAADVVGRPMPIVPSHKRDECAGVRAAIGRGEPVERVETVRMRRDGTPVEVMVSAAPLGVTSGRDGVVLFFEDVTVLKLVHEASARLAAIVESSDDAIVSKNLDGVVTSWNAGAERLFGYTADEMLGQPIRRLIPLERQDDMHTILGGIRRGARVDHYETERVRKDGRRIYVSLTVSPIKDGNGRITGASKIARDVTARRRVESEREEALRLAESARAEAEAASAAKDEFLSVVSHELRTPLASVLGWTAVLKAGIGGERAARAVETIERSGRLQAKLIEDLLDVSRIVTGRMRLDLRRVDLADVLRHAFDGVKPSADARGIEIAATLDPQAGAVVGDPDRLQQVASNLLTNAVKFTPAGGRIEVTLFRRDDGVSVVVRDTGRGIAPEFLPFVFDRFRQAENPESRRSREGLGLGLAIVRHLVELHGGTVAVASEGEGTGATFTVTLPVPRDQPHAAGGTGAILMGLHVLVIDDDADTRDGLALVLQAHGARVSTARSAEEARDIVRADLPDAIVSDIRLPGDDGYTLLRDLRSRRYLRTVPAIAVTGLDADADAGRSTEAGFQLRLGKPVDPETLVVALAQLTARSHAAESRSRHPGR